MTLIVAAPDRAAAGTSDRPSVADAMISEVKIHGVGATVEDLRRFFRGGHVHSAVLVDDGILLAVVDCPDVENSMAGHTLALDIGALTSRVIAPESDLSAARQLLVATGRRRLAVADADGTFRGLLCLKRTRAGFCSARDVQSRANERSARRWSNPAP